MHDRSPFPVLSLLCWLFASLMKTNRWVLLPALHEVTHAYLATKSCGGLFAKPLTLGTHTGLLQHLPAGQAEPQLPARLLLSAGCENSASGIGFVDKFETMKLVSVVQHSSKFICLKIGKRVKTFKFCIRFSRIRDWGQFRTCATTLVTEQRPSFVSCSVGRVTRTTLKLGPPARPNANTAGSFIAALACQPARFRTIGDLPAT